MKKFVIALAIAATAAAASAHGPRAGQDGPKAGRMMKFAAKLNLTDAQKQQIRDIHRADRERNQQLYADLRTKLRALREAKRSGDANADALKAEIQPLREQVKAARKATREQVRGVLTPEQRQQLEQWRADHPRKQRQRG
jgi:periplasmic protein CpxP/Spy